MQHLRILLGLLILGLFAAPTGSAHAVYPTDDGNFNIVVGYQGEPVYTYQATGLDLIIRDNATGGGVPDVHTTLNATLVSPSGQELTYPLEPQHGETSRYEFSEGFVLTEPGLYKLRLSGTINGTQVDGDYAMKHATKPRTEIMFPAEGLDDLQALNERIADLEAQVATLEQNGDTGTNGDGAEQNGAEAPLPVFSLALLGIALLALVRRR